MGYEWATKKSLQVVSTNAMLDIQLTSPHKTNYIQYFISTPKYISNTTGFPYAPGNHLPSYGMAPETKPDHTEHHLTAILLIASIFALLTLGIMGTFLVFYKKKNAVFALQKCEEDSDDNNFELDDLDLTQISFSDTESIQDVHKMGLKRSNTCGDLKIENEKNPNIPRAKTISSLKDISLTKLRSSKKMKKQRRNSSSKSNQYKPLIVTAVLEENINDCMKRKRNSEGCLNLNLKSDLCKESAKLQDYSRLYTDNKSKDRGIHEPMRTFPQSFQDHICIPSKQEKMSQLEAGNAYAFGSDYNIYQEDHTFQQISGQLSIDIHSILPDNQNEPHMIGECDEDDPESKQLLLPQVDNNTNLHSLPQKFYQSRNFFENSSC